MTIIDAINSGKPFRCADIKSSKEIVNPWLIYRDHNGSWFHYAECETAMKQEHLNSMLVEHFSSENWEIKERKTF